MFTYIVYQMNDGERGNPCCAFNYASDVSAYVTKWKGVEFEIVANGHVYIMGAETSHEFHHRILHEINADRREVA